MEHTVLYIIILYIIAINDFCNKIEISLDLFSSFSNPYHELQDASIGILCSIL